MQTIETHWEDEENNRRVAYSVGYTRQSGSVEIKALTPKQVTFLCPESKSELRTISVCSVPVFACGNSMFPRQSVEPSSSASVSLVFRQIS